MLKEGFQELQNALIQAAARHYGSRFVSLVLYGSAARGTQRFDSDLDFLVVAEDLPVGRLRRVEDFEAVESDLLPLLDRLGTMGFRTALSPVFKTRQEALRGSPLFLDMADEAIILFDRDDFFLQVLNRLRERLAILGARRVWRGNAWYWDLKPDFQAGEVFEI
jgi:uncharacterized protein